MLGSGRLTRLINGHPDENADGLRLGSRVTIVGHGNVAIDLVRLMLKSVDELRGLGVADDVIAAITAGPVTHIDVVGRSQPAWPNSTPAMVRELAKTPNVRFLADELDSSAPVDATAGSAKYDALTDAGQTLPAQRRPHRHVPFRLGPQHRRRRRVRRRASSSEPWTAATGRWSWSTDTVCTAIGFTEKETAVLRRAEHESDDADLASGLLGRGLYCVGWLRRGPRGTIPENRADSKMVADTIAPGRRSRRYPARQARAGRAPTAGSPSARRDQNADDRSRTVPEPAPTSPAGRQAARARSSSCSAPNPATRKWSPRNSPPTCESQREAVVHDMTDFDVTDMTADEFYVIVCSTHGDGELPDRRPPIPGRPAESAARPLRRPIRDVRSRRQQLRHLQPGQRTHRQRS